MREKRVGVILAGGSGSRMSADFPKPLVLLAGRPLIEYIAAAVGPVVSRVAVVRSSHAAWRAFEAVHPEWEFVIQSEPLGNGAALSLALEYLDISPDTAVVTVLGDTPRITTTSIASVVDAGSYGLSLLTAPRPRFGSYGSVIRNEDQLVVAIGDAGSGSMGDEVNASVYCAQQSNWVRLLSRLSPGPTGELELPQVVSVCRSLGLEVTTVSAHDFAEAVGANSRDELAQIEELMGEKDW